MELVLAERTTPPERVPGRLGDLVERVRRSEVLLGGQPLNLPAELHAQLVIVGRDERPAVEREVVRRDRVDGSPHNVGEYELTPVDRVVVGLAREALVSRPEGHERGVP